MKNNIEQFPVIKKTEKEMDKNELLSVISELRGKVRSRTYTLVLSLMVLAAAVTGLKKFDSDKEEKLLKNRESIESILKSYRQPYMPNSEIKGSAGNGPVAMMNLAPVAEYNELTDVDAKKIDNILQDMQVQIENNYIENTVRNIP